MPLFVSDRTRLHLLANARVVPTRGRCVQCGVCSFRCPMEIDVRRYVWRGELIADGRCVMCGECVAHCPRGLLRFQEVARRGSGGPT